MSLGVICQFAIIHNFRGITDASLFNVHSLQVHRSFTSYRVKRGFRDTPYLDSIIWIHYTDKSRRWESFC